MLGPRVEQCELRRRRALQSWGRPRGLVIFPKGLDEVPPDIELGHTQSIIVLSVSRGQVFVVETSGGDVDHHRVDLSPDTAPARRGT